ncbi:MULTISPECIES: hypothetical protein [unclassified Paenibacillus]|uniref:hypothetical protein n=1 Tax=unclassified Paenibacillus TaxID=185978 RepID=UPI001F427FF8|nr:MULTISPECIES: hypothetical protein [unclassified Paenibacillus]MCT1397665.1 hypothetical protein [Paenibacillus sp. p3-SID867]
MIGFGVGILFKTCNCGQWMKLELRKLIHERRTRIYHVPVYACQACKKYELLPLIKPDLLRYLASMSNETGRIHVSFADVNESAYVLREVFRTYDDDSSVEWQTRCMEVFDERINMLLDLFRYAQSLGDGDWMRQIEGRLEQLSTIKSLVPENSGNYAR